jgi:catechol 2,3-dioxygenase-like lactoylglutathione lyase family enzyme
MNYTCPLIAVTDIERSKAFYKKYLGQEVVTDFRANVTLTCGIALQTVDSWREFIEDAPVSFKSNNSELVFEADDFDAFLKKLDGAELVHPPKEHAWGQRVARFYDPDGHIIEVGENMPAVSSRFLNAGMTIAEIAARMDVREEYVRGWLAAIEVNR